MEAFKQLADVFASISDPQLRAALGAEALGKAWAGAAPLLAEGGDKIQEMVDKGKAMSGMTTEIAQQADAFNDKLIELTGTGSLANAMLASAMPLLNAVADGLLKSRDGAGQAHGGFSALTEILRVIIVVGGNVSYVVRAIGTELETLGQQFVAFATRDFNGFVKIHEDAVAAAKKARTEHDHWERSMMAARYGDKVAR